MLVDFRALQVILGHAILKPSRKATPIRSSLVNGRVVHHDGRELYHPVRGRP